MAIEEKVKCPRCDGEGSIAYSYGYADTCPLCNGMKKVRQSEIDYYRCKCKETSYNEVMGSNWEDY